MHEQFIHGLSVRLSEVLDKDTLREVVTRIQLYTADYNIEQKTTEIAVISDCPGSLKAFIVSRKIEGTAESTLEAYYPIICQFYRYVGKSLEDITTSDVRAYLYNVQKDRGLSNRTLRTRQAIIGSYLEWCANEGYIGHNPARSVKPIKYSSKPREPLSDVEMELLRSVCKTPREKAIVEFIYSTGCRVSEMTGLKIQDLNFDRKEVLLLGKGNKYRTSYLNARAEIALTSYLNGKKPSPDDSVFSSERKPYKGVSRRTIEDIVSDLGKRAGINRSVYPHLIRHTTATDGLNRGMDITEIQQLLGHSNVNTTLIYAKVDKEKTKSDHRRCL